MVEHRDGSQRAGDRPLERAGLDLFELSKPLRQSAREALPSPGGAFAMLHRRSQSPGAMGVPRADGAKIGARGAGLLRYCW